MLEIQQIFFEFDTSPIRVLRVSVYDTCVLDTDTSFKRCVKLLTHWLTLLKKKMNELTNKLEEIEEKVKEFIDELETNKHK